MAKTNDTQCWNGYEFPAGGSENGPSVFEVHSSLFNRNLDHVRNRKFLLALPVPPLGMGPQKLKKAVFHSGKTLYINRGGSISHCPPYKPLLLRGNK